MKTLKILLQSLREFKRPSILAPVYVVGEVGMEVAIPFIMSILIDQGINAKNMHNVIFYGVILLILAVISLFCGIMAGREAAIGSCGLSKNLRQDMYYRVQKFAFSNIDRFSTASIVTRLTTDVTNVQNAYQMAIRTLARSPIMLIAALVVSFTINWKMALIFVIIIPILFFLLIWLAIKVHPYFEHVFNTYDDLNEVVEENLYGIRVVKSYTREDHENRKFGKISNSIYKNFMKAEKIVTLNMPLMMLAIYACIICVAWFGAHIIVASGGIPGNGGLSTGELMSLFTYSMQILMSLMMISMVFVMVIMARSSGHRIAELLTTESDIKNCENPIMDVPDGSIEFDHVQFAYSEKAEKPVLSDINLKIKSGETIGIIGGTGSSKSSLVQLIPRLYDVTGGELKVGGHDVRDYDLKTLRDQVAMVLQKNVLFSGTIKENLRWGNPNASDEDIVRVCKQAQADDFIEKFPMKYDTYIEQGGTNVSGGQKQRLCIARALLKKPKILILDDSTSAVDTKTDALIRQAFLEEIPDTTKIIIAQRISSVQDADRIIVLDEGRVTDVGTHEELLKTSNIYREVYESQQKGGME